VCPRFAVARTNASVAWPLGGPRPNGTPAHPGLSAAFCGLGGVRHRPAWVVYLAGRWPSSRDRMAASTCGHAVERGLAISKWPARRMVIIRTESPARAAAAA
jgi:hypothetical protein